MRDVLKVVKLDNLVLLREFQNFCFGLLGTATHDEFSKKVINFQSHDDRFTANLQDKILSSQEFLHITKHTALSSLAAKIMNVEQEDIKIVLPFFRIDLPQQFVKEDKKMSLPWHQEAGYFLAKRNCTPNSIVMSIALHDCTEENGALHVACNTKDKVIKHKSFFMEKNLKKKYRAECSEPEEFTIASSKFGQVVAFDFKRPHRSGVNKSNLVRLTLILRATSEFELNQFMNH